MYEPIQFSSVHMHVCACVHGCVHVLCATPCPVISIASRLTNFMKLCCHTEPMDEMAAGGYLSQDHASSQEGSKAFDLSQALDKLTQSRLESRLQGRRRFLRSTLQAGVGRLQGMAGVGPVAAAGGLGPDQLDNILIVSVASSSYVWEVSASGRCLRLGGVCVWEVSVSGRCLCLGRVCVWEVSASGRCLCLGGVCVWEVSVGGICLCLGGVCVWKVSVSVRCLCLGEVCVWEVSVSGRCMCLGGD